MKKIYIRLCIKNNYLKRELHRQIQSHYYERFYYLKLMLVNKIANKIKGQYPTLNDLSKRNLYLMIQFYEIYKDNKKVRTLLAQLGMINFTVMI